MIASTSFGSSFASSRARCDARSARSEVASPSATTRRSRIPVRSTIHWSFVSTSFSRSAFVTTFSGTNEPVPAMRERIEVLRGQAPCFVTVARVGSASEGAPGLVDSASSASEGATACAISSM